MCDAAWCAPVGLPVRPLSFTFTAEEDLRRRRRRRKTIFSLLSRKHFEGNEISKD